MSPNFLPFAKAFFRYRFGLWPTTAWNWRLMALRALDHVLSARGAGTQVTSITNELLDEARDLIIGGYTQTAAAKILGELQALSDFLIECEFVQMRTRWLKNIARARGVVDRIAEAFVLRKAGLVNEENRPASKDARVNALTDKVGELEAEIIRLKAECNAY